VHDALHDAFGAAPTLVFATVPPDPLKSKARMADGPS